MEENQSDEPERDLREGRWSLLGSKERERERAVAAPNPWQAAAIGARKSNKSKEMMGKRDCFVEMNGRGGWRCPMNEDGGGRSAGGETEENDLPA